MEESHEILLKALENSGVLIPSCVSSIRELNPNSLFSICSQLVRVLADGGDDDDDRWLISDSLPETMTERFKVCSEMAEAVKKLGYIGDMSFHKFLYPSEEDMYKLLRFLIERLSTSSKTEDENVIAGKTRNFSIATSTANKDDIEEVSKINIHDPCKEELISEGADEKLLVAFAASRGGACESEEPVSELAQTPSSGNDNSPMVVSKDANLEEAKKRTSNNSDLQHTDEEHGILKDALEMATDGHHLAYAYVEQHNSHVDSNRRTLMQLKSHWKASNESMRTTKAEVSENHSKVIEVEQELQSILSEIRKRDEQHYKLSEDFANQPKVAPRRSYIDRITEITKNSRKQDADIERILKDTRELQIESNSIQERLHRTYAVVEETVFREAKKDPVGKQAYKLLVDIHQSFEEISEKILATDRMRREAADHEIKLTGMASRSLNIEKLQADLDAIRKENEHLVRAMQS